MVQWLTIHLYIHHKSVLKYFKQYKLTFFFSKLTLHRGTCKAALSKHVESILTVETCRPLWTAPAEKGGRETTLSTTGCFFFFLVKCSACSTVKEKKEKKIRKLIYKSQGQNSKIEDFVHNQVIFWLLYSITTVPSCLWLSLTEGRWALVSFFSCFSLLDINQISVFIIILQTSYPANFSPALQRRL